MNVCATFSYINPVAPSPVTITIELPSKCPHCNTGFSRPPEAGIAYWQNDRSKNAYAIYFCPTCETCFFGSYIVTEDLDGFSGFLNQIYPSPSSTSHFSDKLAGISPKFVEIYQQAEQAESEGLNEICGIGYRKSLEFLVKDYAIAKHPEKRSKIESSFLSNCISSYIEEPKIKTLAIASSWIGNDETHYVRKHEDYNVQDLKRFISTTVAYIEYELNYEEAAKLCTPLQ